MDEKFIEALRPLFQFLYHIYFRVDAIGVENVPQHKPAILVANHSGGLPYDGVMIHLAVYNNHISGRNVRFLVEDFIFNIPLLSEFITRAGGVRACHANATDLLRSGNLIAVFPEGVKGVGKSYDDRYKLERFGNGGFVRLAMRTKMPIIPVSVIGAEEIHPVVWKSHLLGKALGVPFIPFTPTFPWLGPLGLIPLPSKWRIVFGKPIFFDKFGPKDAENDKLVLTHSERIREIIQKTLNRELKNRKSIWS